MLNGDEIRRERERIAAERRPLTGDQFLTGIQRAGVRIIDKRKNKGNGSSQR